MKTSPGPDVHDPTEKRTSIGEGYGDSNVLRGQTGFRKKEVMVPSLAGNGKQRHGVGFRKVGRGRG